MVAQKAEADVYKRFLPPTVATIGLLAFGAMEAAYATSTGWQIAWPLLALATSSGFWWRALRHKPAHS